MSFINRSFRVLFKLPSFPVHAVLSFSIDQTVLLPFSDHNSCYPQKIANAGGKKASEVEPEGNRGLMQHFEDTEGNWVGLYTMKK